MQDKKARHGRPHPSHQSQPQLALSVHGEYQFGADPVPFAAAMRLFRQPPSKQLQIHLDSPIMTRSMHRLVYGIVRPPALEISHWSRRSQLLRSQQCACQSRSAELGQQRELPNSHAKSSIVQTSLRSCEYYAYMKLESDPWKLESCINCKLLDQNFPGVVHGRGKCLLEKEGCAHQSRAFSIFTYPFLKNS